MSKCGDAEDVGDEDDLRIEGGVALRHNRVRLRMIASHSMQYLQGTHKVTGNIQNTYKYSLRMNSNVSTLICNSMRTTKVNTAYTIKYKENSY